MQKKALVAKIRMEIFLRNMDDFFSNSNKMWLVLTFLDNKERDTLVVSD